MNMLTDGTLLTYSGVSLDYPPTAHQNRSLYPRR